MTDAILAISLHQPWASLIFVEDEDRKHHETRHWPFAEALKGQRVAFHAAKHFEKPTQGWPLDRLCVAHFGSAYRTTLPRGAFLGTAILSGCYPTAEREPMGGADLMAGNWEPGRFAWHLTEPQLLAQPVPAIGRQKWWRVPRSTLGL